MDSAAVADRVSRPVVPGDLVGRRLDGVTVSWHRYPGEEPSHLHVWLSVEGLGQVRLHTPGDAVTLDLDEPHGPYSMAEHGQVTVEPAAPGFPLSRFVGERVEAVGEVRDATLDAAVGFVLRFPSGGVEVWNRADEIEIGLVDGG